MANKIKPARAVKNRIETVKETLEPYELIISTDTEQIAYKKSNNEVAYMANEKNVQEKLVSGVNIKTVGMQSLLGSGNISIPSTDEFASKQELAPYISSKNLAMPDLTGKEYLGDGVYRLYDDIGITIDYNIFNGNFTINGTVLESENVNLSSNVPANVYTGTLIYISGERNNTGAGAFRIGSSASPDAFLYFINTIPTSPVLTKTYSSTGDFPAVRFWVVSGNEFTNYTFKVQLEKGTEATPFAVPAGVIPYIPEVKTQFDSKLDKTVAEASYVKTTGNQDVDGYKSFIKSITTKENVDFMRDNAYQASLSVSDKKLIVVGGNKPGEIAVMSDLNWTLIATNGAQSTDYISIPVGTKEILIIGNDGSNSVILPNVNNAMSTSVLFTGANEVTVRATWTVMSDGTLRKTWGSGSNIVEMTYSIYGR